MGYGIDTTNRADRPAAGRRADLALQPELGLWPQRCSGTAPPRPADLTPVQRTGVAWPGAWALSAGQPPELPQVSRGLLVLENQQAPVCFSHLVSSRSSSTLARPRNWKKEAVVSVALFTVGLLCVFLITAS